jgi:hypothetical protein
VQAFQSQSSGKWSENFANDFRIIDKVVEFAEAWNTFCSHGHEILVNKGDIKKTNSGIGYLVEPLIRCYTKFNSNSGWIDDNDDWTVRAMAAFSHYSYHRSGGSLVVCDLQGRYKFNRFARKEVALSSQILQFVRDSAYMVPQI